MRSIDHQLWRLTNINTVLYSSPGGQHQGTVWSTWFNEPSSGAQLNLKVNSPMRQLCVPFPCHCTTNPNTQSIGAVVEGYEYRRTSSGATPFWTPLRFPGQYHDEETDLNQNWNRFYEALTGRYLEPEPMLSSVPEYATKAAKRGVAVPYYAYADNSPLSSSDPKGREVCPYGSSCEGCVEMTVGGSDCMVCAESSKTTCPDADDPLSYCAKESIETYLSCLAQKHHKAVCVASMEDTLKDCMARKLPGPPHCKSDPAPLAPVPLP